jgi:acetyl-CoA acetyltransferase
MGIPKPTYRLPEENMKTIFEILRKAWRLIMAGEEQRYITGIVEKVQDTLMETNGELRQLMAEFREHRGEFKEFKQHVMGRVERLESNEGKRRREFSTVISIGSSG